MTVYQDKEDKRQDSSNKMGSDVEAAKMRTAESSSFGSKIIEIGKKIDEAKDEMARVFGEPQKPADGPKGSLFGNKNSSSQSSQFAGDFDFEITGNQDKNQDKSQDKIADFSVEVF